MRHLLGPDALVHAAAPERKKRGTQQVFTKCEQAMPYTFPSYALSRTGAPMTCLVCLSALMK